VIQLIEKKEDRIIFGDSKYAGNKMYDTFCDCCGERITRGVPIAGKIEVFKEYTMLPTIDNKDIYYLCLACKIKAKTSEGIRDTIKQKTGKDII
jgi:hypothetical protein